MWYIYMYMTLRKMAGKRNSTNHIAMRTFSDDYKSWQNNCSQFLWSHKAPPDSTYHTARLKIMAYR